MLKFHYVIVSLTTLLPGVTWAISLHFFLGVFPFPFCVFLSVDVVVDVVVVVVVIVVVVVVVTQSISCMVLW